MISSSLQSVLVFQKIPVFETYGGSQILRLVLACRSDQIFFVLGRCCGGKIGFCPLLIV